MPLKFSKSSASHADFSSSNRWLRGEPLVGMPPVFLRPVAFLFNLESAFCLLMYATKMIEAKLPNVPPMIR